MKSLNMSESEFSNAINSLIKHRKKVEDRGAFLINSLIEHVKNVDPSLYNSLSEFMQNDRRLAKAATETLGCRRNITKDNNSEEEEDAKSPWTNVAAGGNTDTATTSATNNTDNNPNKSDS